ncbi:RsmD family RNA methyltransferase [Candidatus Micrarchaeota archaeon]|nr:RsmD family RNA methyltransferase [Candidatus Micrarchaeota archaeon]
MLIFLTKKIAQYIIKNKKQGYVLISPDLNKSHTKLKVNPNMFDIKILKKITQANAVYYYDTETKKYYKIALYEFDEKKHKGVYCQLNVFDKIPVLTINGFRMHRVINDPLKYVKDVINSLDINNKTVLDTCMGLGYTAIEASKKTKSVTTCEKYKSVYNIAKVNPWSEELFKNKNINAINKDVIEYLKNNKKFDIIIHDPPTIKFSPELYSKDFYELVNNASHPKTKMYHYFGDLTKKQNMNAFEHAKKTLNWKVIKQGSMGAIFLNS